MLVACLTISITSKATTIHGLYQTSFTAIHSSKLTLFNETKAFTSKSPAFAKATPIPILLGFQNATRNPPLHHYPPSPHHPGTILPHSRRRIHRTRHHPHALRRQRRGTFTLLATLTRFTSPSSLSVFFFPRPARLSYLTLHENRKRYHKP